MIILSVGSIIIVGKQRTSRPESNATKDTVSYYPPDDRLVKFVECLDGRPSFIITSSAMNLLSISTRCVVSSHNLLCAEKCCEVDQLIVV